MDVFLFLIFIFLTLIYFLNLRIKAKRMEQIKSDPEYILNYEGLSAFFDELTKLKKDYIVHDAGEHLINKYRSIYKYMSKIHHEKLKDKQIEDFLNVFKNLSELIKDWNKQYIDSKLSKHEKLFDNIDGKSLDSQQRKAVVVDESNNLVLAGAGSGKTLTISGKVKYLVETKNVNPNDILLISFTKKAAEEMKDRITNKLHIGVEVRTFHSLGLDIIRHTYSEKYDVCKDGYLNNIIEDYFRKGTTNNKIQMRNIIYFFNYYLNIPKDWEEFESLGDCIDYYKNLDFETLKNKVQSVEDEVMDSAATLKVSKNTLQGEVVKSLEEVMIANFLYLNGVNYEYERKYPYDTDDKYKKNYQPDFYLTDYDIYIEHFGITEDYRAPWLSEIEEKKYVDGITWKRDLHKANKTTLIETYSFYNKEGILLSELEKKLKNAGVKFKEVDYSDIYRKVFNKQNNIYLQEFIKLIGTFIKLFKSSGFDESFFENLYHKAELQSNSFLIKRSRLFLNIVHPIFLEYQRSLKNSGQIDFDDMINLATESIKQGRGEFNYKYIIIDEYQDIAISRFNLIKEIKNRTHAKLLCVGDDWQSIYRFAGSDITLFTDFGKYFGYYELLKIEKTYRNSQELIDIAGMFVTRNPKQLQKNLISNKHHSKPIRIIGYSSDLISTVSKVINEIVVNYGPKADITILGRNNFDKDIFKEQKDYYVTDSIFKYTPYPNLNLKFLTAHKSKGLESDNVIVINLENKLLGFPNKIADDPVLSMVLTDQDEHSFSEERRLFYVAITRTKNTTYLLTPDKAQSAFVSELIQKFKVDYEFNSTKGEKSIKANPTCPKCQTGHLIIRENLKTKEQFLGCEHFPNCDYTLKDIGIIDNQIKCRVCGGYMAKRKGQYGDFYGCTNYPYCDNKLPVKKY